MKDANRSGRELTQAIGVFFVTGAGHIEPRQFADSGNDMSIARRNREVVDLIRWCDMRLDALFVTGAGRDHRLWLSVDWTSRLSTARITSMRMNSLQVFGLGAGFVFGRMATLPLQGPPPPKSSCAAYAAAYEDEPLMEAGRMIWLCLLEEP